MHRRGFAPIIVVFIIATVLAVGGVYWYFHKKPQGKAAQDLTSPTTEQSASSSPPIWGQYDINAPDALMLVDSQGRRTGENPITGIFYREIPNTAYSIGAAASGHQVGELTFSNLSSGQYTLYVLGGETGLYGVGINNNHGQQSFQGNIQAGAMVAYVQNYDPSNLPSSTFSYAGISSSTASITSAPANNLP